MLPHQAQGSMFPQTAGEYRQDAFPRSEARALFETILAWSLWVAFAQTQAEQSCICFPQQVPEKKCFLVKIMLRNTQVQ